MRYSLPTLLLLSACGPDSEQLERIVRLEAAVEALQVEVGELQEDAEKQQEAVEGPVKCASAKKVAFDAWMPLMTTARGNKTSANAAGSAAFNALFSINNMEDRTNLNKIEDRMNYWKGIGGYWNNRVGAASGARQTATGGAIKAKAAADYATSLHDAEQWDTTEATAASAASWEACKEVDP